MKSIARCTWSPDANVPLSVAVSPPWSNSLRAFASNSAQLVAVAMAGSTAAVGFVSRFALLNSDSPPTSARAIANNAIPEAFQVSPMLFVNIAASSTVGAKRPRPSV
jgi:hypothetical protein